jgi:hypothetical protein
MQGTNISRESEKAKDKEEKASRGGLGSDLLDPFTNPNSSTNP